MRSNVLWTALVLVIVACGGGKGGSGIDPNRVISTMTDAEIMALCNEARHEFPPRVVTCDGTAMTVGVQAEDCATDMFLHQEGCNATVEEVLDCVAALGDLTDAQVCDAESSGPPPQCDEELLACVS